MDFNLNYDELNSEEENYDEFPFEYENPYELKFEELKNKIDYLNIDDKLENKLNDLRKNNKDLKNKHFIINENKLLIQKAEQDKQHINEFYDWKRGYGVFLYDKEERDMFYDKIEEDRKRALNFILIFD